MIYLLIGVLVAYLIYRKIRMERVKAIFRDYLNSEDFKRKLYREFLEETYTDENKIYSCLVSQDAYKYWKKIFDTVEGVDKLQDLFKRYVDIKY